MDEDLTGLSDWSQFLRGCLKYREALERELPRAPRHKAEYE